MDQPIREILKIFEDDQTSLPFSRRFNGTREILQCRWSGTWLTVDCLYSNSSLFEPMRSFEDLRSPRLFEYPSRTVRTLWFSVCILILLSQRIDWGAAPIECHSAPDWHSRLNWLIPLAITGMSFDESCSSAGIFPELRRYPLCVRTCWLIGSKGLLRKERSYVRLK